MLQTERHHFDRLGASYQHSGTRRTLYSPSSTAVLTCKKLCDHADDGVVKLSQERLLDGLIVDILQGRVHHQDLGPVYPSNRVRLLGTFRSTNSDDWVRIDVPQSVGKPLK